jgi:AcrR family transcriptional regulator
MADVTAAGQGGRSAAAKPRGREEVVEALLASARSLIAARGPGVALREIADDAGVNFGLLYHYLGTKDQVVDVVYRAAAQAAAGRLAESADIDEALERLMHFGDGTTARLMAWAVLEGHGAAPAFRDSPALRVLADLIIHDDRPHDPDGTTEEARVFAAFAMSVALAWRLFGETALLAAGVEPADPDHHLDRVTGYLQQLAMSTSGAAGARTTEPPLPAVDADIGIQGRQSGPDVAPRARRRAARGR